MIKITKGKKFEISGSFEDIMYEWASITDVIKEKVSKKFEINVDANGLVIIANEIFKELEKKNV